MCSDVVVPDSLLIPGDIAMVFDLTDMSGLSSNLSEESMGLDIASCKNLPVYLLNLNTIAKLLNTPSYQTRTQEHTQGPIKTVLLVPFDADSDETEDGGIQ